jgi:hypothetical protein
MKHVLHGENLSAGKAGDMFYQKHIGRLADLFG